MASIERRGKNSFRLIVEAGYNEFGKRIKRYKTVSVSGIREAEKELAKFQAEVESGQYFVPEKITFSTFVQKWREMYGDKHLEPKTLENYDHLLKNHILPVFGPMKIADVKPMQILSFLDSLTRDGARKDGKSGGLSTTTIRFIHRVMKDIFERTVDWHLISTNPVTAVKRPKIINRESEVYDEQEASKLFQALEKEPAHWRIMVTLALTTGLRRGELLALEWKHIDLESSIIEVVQSLSHSRGITRIKVPKTKNSKRKVTIPDTLIADLKSYREMSERQKQQLGDLWKGGEKFFVFFSEKGKPFYHTAPGKWLSRFIRRNELKHIRFHDLRHTSATLLINQGVHAKIIASRLGHADIRTTMNIYGHALQSADQAAANTFNNLLDSRKTNYYKN